MLKFRVQSLDEIDEKYHDLYEEKEVEGAKWFILKVEGAVDQTRVRELTTKINTFRSTNTKLADRLKVFAEQAELEIDDSMTPQDLAEALAEKRREIEESLKTGGGKAPSKEELDKLVEQRIQQFKSQSETNQRKLAESLKVIETERDSLFQNLEKVSIENEVVSKATSKGLRSTAQLDIVTRARSIFRLKEGSVRALMPDGETPVYGPDGLTELTIEDWIDLQASKEAPHLFESNSGSGAPGSSGGASRSGQRRVNPWKRESRNMTEQMRIRKSDPALAKRLMAEAGR